MNQRKGFANIVLIVLLVVLAGVVGYFVLVKKPEQITHQPNSTNTTTPTKAPISPTSSTSDQKTYKNNKNFFSFSYPSKWSLSDLGNDNLLLKNEAGKAVIQIAPHLRNLDYDYQNTLEKDIKSSFGGEYMGVQKTENIMLEKITDNIQTLGYVSQWNITGVDNTFLETRADFESKLEQPSVTQTGKYKTVFSFVSQQDFNDLNLLKSIALTFRFNR